MRVAGVLDGADLRQGVVQAPPKELGGDGEGANPEELFAIGYATCFATTLDLVGIAANSRRKTRRSTRRFH
ncbi:hypothetical protein [Streptomyces sp. NPDC048436]|uniref:hypothetical protein n=1 Tax=Streptomyces sp. NPDC048436 TaxID=3365550 RepID=UPI003724220E